MQPFLDWAIDHWGFCAFVLAIFVQFTPAIKWNPITALFSWIGKIIVQDVRGDIAKMSDRVEDMEESIDENEKDRIRWEVLNYANACRNGIRHTKDEFQHIITLKGKYDKLLKKTGDTNGVFEAEYEYILNLYRERQEKNDFL